MAATDTNIGYASLQVIPVVKDIGKNASSQIIGPIGKAGEDAGKAAGQGIVSGISASKSAVEKASSAVASARKKEEDAAGKVRVAEAQLQSLRERGITDVGRLTAATEKVAAAKRAEAEASSKTKTAVSGMETATRAAATATTNLGTAARGSASDVAKVGTASDSAQSGLSKFGATALAGAGLAFLATKAMEVVKFVQEIGETFTAVNSKIQLSTGASGAVLDGLTESVKNVAKGSPASISSIADKMTILYQRTGLTGESLENLTKQVNKAGGAIGQDLDLKVITQSMAAFGVTGDQMGVVLDDMFRVARNTGVGMNELSGSVIRAAPSLQEFGFSLSDSVSLVGNLDKAGIDATSVLGTFGKGLVSIAKAGQAPQDAFKGVTKEIEGFLAAGDTGAAVNVAGKIFGTKGAVQFVNAVKSGQISMESLTGAAAIQGDGIMAASGATVTFAKVWGLFKNNVIIALEPLATKFFGVFIAGLTWLRTNGTIIIQALVAAFQSLAEGGLGDLFMRIWNGVAAVLTELQGGITALVAAFKDGSDDITSSGLAGFLEMIGVQARNLYDRFMADVLPALQSTAEIISNVLGAAIPPLVAGVTWLVDAFLNIVSVLTTVAGFFAENRDITLALAGVIVGFLLPTMVSLGIAFATTAIQSVVMTARLVAYIVVQGAVNAATTAWAAATWLVTAAMNANPVGLLIAGIVALVAGIIICYNRFEGFRNVLHSIWDVIKGVASAIWDFLGAAITWIGEAFQKVVGFVKEWWRVLIMVTGPLGLLVNAVMFVIQHLDFFKAALGVVVDFFVAGFNLMKDAAMFFWRNVIEPVFKAITFIISLWWAAIRIFWELLKIAWKSIETAALWLWHNVFEPVFNGILSAVSLWWSAVQVFWGYLTTAWRAIETAAMWLWNNVFVPVFDGIRNAVSLWWAGVNVVWDALLTAWAAIETAAMWLWHNVIEPSFNGIQTAISVFWSAVGVVFDAFMGGLGFIGDKANWLWNTIFVPAFNGIKGAISTAWDFIRPVLDNIGKGIEAVGDIASLVGDSIRNAFDGVVSVVKAPIHAIGSLLASIPESILGVDIPGAGTVKSWGRTLQNLRTGGVVDNGLAGRSNDGRLWGPGNGTSDSILGVDKFGIPTALVSNREGIVTENAMDNGGAALVAALNSGWTPSSGELDKMFPGLPAFADGGVVVAKTLDLARGEHGKPYQYGGVGNPSWDCSGITSGVYASLLGKDIHTRWFTTEADFASLGFLPGFTEGDVNKGYNIGVHNGGGGMNSHMAGTLSGHKIESGGNGVQFDGNVGADATQFEKQYHLDPALFGGLAANKPKFNTLTGKYVSPAYSDTGTAGTTADASGTTGTAKDSTRMKSFKELGSDMGGILAEGIGESLGLPDWLMDPQSFIESGDDGASVRTTTSAATAGNQAIVDNAPAVTGGDANPAVPEEKNRVGMELYAYEIARAAKALGFNRDGATIGMGVPLVEVGDPMKMYANNKVPDSLSFPHDAVGSDGTSVGIYQQSDNGAWGSVADRMDPYKSAEMFFNTLKDVQGWEGMDKGAAAQAVQRSAFPSKYAGVMPRAEELLGGTSLFDTGGIWEPGTFGFNGLKEPELVLKKHQWGVIDRQTDAVEALVSQGGRGRGGVDNRLAETVNIQGYTMDEVATEWRSAQWNRTAGYGTSRNR